MRRLVGSFVLAVALAAAALLALAGPAAAHVTVSSADAAPGGYAVLTFRVPTESATASTTKLVVALPTDTPLASVSVQTVPGWTTATRTSRLRTPLETDDGQVTSAVSQVTWTAQRGAAIEPGQFQQFDLSVGPLPDRSSLSFPAIQTYSDGSVVRWIEKQAAGSSTEPEHPAPTLELAASSSGAASTGTDSTGTESSGTDSAGATRTVTAEPASNIGPVVLSIIALVLAAGALSVALVGRARRSAS